MKTKILIFVSFFFILNSSFLIHNCMCQWESDSRLTNDPGSSYTSRNNARCIVVNGNVVHTVWYDNRNGNYEIYYKRSSDNGIIWGEDKRLTNNTAGSYSPSIAVSDSLIFVVWFDNRDGNYEIYFKLSNDSGFTWDPDTRLTNSPSYSEYPSIAVHDSILHVTWNDSRDGNLEIYYKRSTDSGINWGTDLRLTNNTAPSIHPSIAVSGSIVHVTWEDSRDGNIEIYYKNSTNGGLTWGEDTRLTIAPAYSMSPSIAVSGSLINIVWQDYRDGNNGEIYYKHSINGGLIWGTDQRLSNDTSVSENPSIAASDSLLHLVWDDNRNGNYEIYYKRSTNSGFTWGTDKRLTNAINSSLSPFISIFGSLVNIVWSDIRFGNYEIFYKRNPFGNLLYIQNISSEIPSAFSLSQNYPNPFNAMTNVKFQIANSGNVKITVFNILGKEVATLVNESLQPGTYETTFDASNLSSGIYFYQLRSDNFIQTKKLTLIK